MTSTLWCGGRIRTPLDPAATAILVEEGTVAWVGREEQAALLTADTVVHLDGAWLAPAFVDAHVHTTSTGLALTGLDLTDATSLAEALRRVERAVRRAHGGVVLGTGWDDTRWPERRPPTAAELDRASFGGVVYLARTDVHSAVASSALLAAVPEARAAPGYLPDGLVRQGAHHLIRRAAYAAVTARQRRLAQETALQRAAALGLACVHECGGPDIAGEQDFLDLLAADTGVQVVGYWGELDAVDKARELGAVGAGGDLFVDGALGSCTAALGAPYAGGDSTGVLYLDAADVERHVTACTRAGLQAGFHAIGDRALTTVLTGFSAAAEQVGSAAVRAGGHRIEHAEMLAPDHLVHLAACGLTASVQPAFDARWGGPDGMYAERLGRARAVSMNPFAALAAAGVPLALGSDAPVTALDPWGAVRSAVQHRTAGSGLSPAQAFEAHTAGGWRAGGDPFTGPLTVGAPATFCGWQLEGDLVDGLPDLDGPAPRCLLTVVAGRVVFEISERFTRSAARREPPL